MTRNGLRILLLLAYIFLIFVASSIPGLGSPDSRFAMPDKVAHFIEYAILGGLLFSAIKWQVSRSRLATLGFLFAVGASIAALDEIYQSYIPSRSMSEFDWIADAIGVLVGVGLFVLTPLGRRKRGNTGPTIQAEKGN